MATRKTKIPRKNRAKEDDTLVDIVDARDKAQGFFERNQKTVVGVATLVALVIGALVSYKFFVQEPKEDNAREQIQMAEKQFERDSFALALENPGNNYEGFLDIIENYNGTSSANMAKYYAGVCFLNLGKYEEAVDYLSSFSPSGKITPLMKNGTLGDAYSELSDFDKALDHYKKAAYGVSNNFLSPYYLKKYAMLSEKQGNNDEAQKAYQLIKNKYPMSTEGGTVDRYLK